MYKENLPVVASSALRTIYHLSSIPGANTTACLPQQSMPHKTPITPPVQHLQHSTSLSSHPINQGKSPMVFVPAHKGSDNGQPLPVITVSLKKASGSMQGSTTFIIGPKAKEIAPPAADMLIDSNKEQHCSFVPVQVKKNSGPFSSLIFILLNYVTLYICCIMVSTCFGIIY